MLTRHSTLTISTLASLVLLAACDSSTGGAAGDDDDDNSDAIALLTPFSGIYDLQDNWNGSSGDEAFLLIENPGANGTAPVEFYDFDDFSNCLPTRSSTGVLRRDEFTGSVFMDDLLQFDQAILTLSGSTLSIEFNDDLDLDQDGSTQDRYTITAERLGVAQISDLGQEC